MGDSSHDSCSGSSSVPPRLVHGSLRAVVLFLLLVLTEEFAKSGLVSRSLCALGMNKLTRTLMGRLRPN